MSRPYRPGDVVLDSCGTWFVRRDGSLTRFDPQRHAARQRTRRSLPADTREMVL